MQTTEQIAKHLRDFHFGDNWTEVSLKDKLADVTWEQANGRIGSLHSIATITFHINYFVTATLKVLRGGPLDASDKFSFDVAPMRSTEDWEQLQAKAWEEAEELAGLIEQLPENTLSEDFVEARYGTYYRCLQGLIEHCYYHLGQISMMKTLLKIDENDA